jgi:hypothetical protein
MTVNPEAETASVLASTLLPWATLILTLRRSTLRFPSPLAATGIMGFSFVVIIFDIPR